MLKISRLQQVLKLQYDNFRSGWMKYKTGLKSIRKKRKKKKSIDENQKKKAREEINNVGNDNNKYTVEIGSNVVGNI